MNRYPSERLGKLPKSPQGSKILYSRSDSTLKQLSNKPISKHNDVHTPTLTISSETTSSSSTTTSTNMSNSSIASLVVGSDAKSKRDLLKVDVDDVVIDVPDDPKTPSEWWLYLRDKTLGEDSAGQIRLYTNAMQSIDYTRYSNDEHLVRIWIEFIHLQISNCKADTSLVRKFFERMNSLAIGKKSALFYAEWAAYEISQNDYARARKILLEGRSNDANPSEMIEHRIKVLEDKENYNQKNVVAKPNATRVEDILDNNTCTMNIVDEDPGEKSIIQSAPDDHIKQTPFSKKSALLVNGNTYIKLEMLGKGGSSKVYKVLSASGKILAIKRVILKGVDPTTLSGYINEIELLKKMSCHDRIIKVYESEINKKGGYIHMVMECGEIDLANVLQNQSKDGIPLNLNFIRVYWEQAVHCIHEERVVHTDLKPANFLFVRGSLKLIDFGIAKAIQNDTTNIHRDHHVGTVNYMSPEAILDTNKESVNADGSSSQCMKLGRQSDVWSLGCILYQMVYGKTPFSHLSVIQKLQKIIDPTYSIDYPELGDRMRNPFIIPMLKSCLKRDPKARLTIPELLKHPFLRPDKIMQSLIYQSSEAQKKVKESVFLALELREKCPHMSNYAVWDEVKKQKFECK